MTQEHASNRIDPDKFWQFCLDYYEQKGVKEACLELQNQHGGNVNLLLLLKYLDTSSLSLPQNDIDKLIQALERSETQLLEYRTLRKLLKSHIPNDLYKEVLRFELSLEREQQADLVQRLSTLTLSDSNTGLLVSTYCERINAVHLINYFL